MLPRWTKLWTLLCVVLMIQLVSAGSFRVERREDGDDQASKSIQSRSLAQSITKPTSTKQDEPHTTTSSVAEEETSQVETSSTPAISVTTSSYISSATGIDNSTVVNGMSKLFLDDGPLTNGHLSHRLCWQFTA